MQKLAPVLIALIVIAAAVASVFIILPLLQDTGPAGGGEVVTDATELEAIAIGFVQPPYQDDYNSLRVAGYVDNMSDRTVYETKVTIDLLDEDDNRQEVIEHRVQNIPPRSRKWFDIDGGTYEGPREAFIVVDSVEFAR